MKIIVYNNINKQKRDNMKSIKNFLKSASIFFVGHILSKIMVFFTLPIITFYISPEAYGKYDLSLNIIQLLVTVTFSNIWSAIMRYMFDSSDYTHKAHIVSNGIVAFLTLLSLYSLASCLILPYFSVDYPWLLYLLGIFIGVDNVYGHIVRGYGENRLFALSGIVDTIVSMSLSLVFVMQYKLSYEALYTSALIGILSKLFIIEQGLRVLKQVKFAHIDITIIKHMLVFAVPLSINSAAYWFLTSYNRVLISEQLSFSDNGLLAVAMKIAGPISVIAVCLQMAWQELAFKHSTKAVDESNEMFYSDAINLYIKFLTILTSFTIFGLYMLFPIIMSPDYLKAIHLVPWCVLATALMVYSAFLGDIFGALKKTKFLFITLLLSSFVNFAILSCGIKIMGIYAAPIALIVSFFINCFFHSLYYFTV